jgi:hypothetical protein
MTTMTTRSLIALSLAALALGPACHRARDRWDPDRPVGLTVEVRDGVGGGLLSGATIELIEVEHEWSGCVCVSPYEVFGITDGSGQVRFEPEDFADAEVGFLEDRVGRAILRGRPDQDEAIVTVLVTRPGYHDDVVPVLLTNSRPDRLAVVMLEPTD